MATVTSFNELSSESDVTTQHERTAAAPAASSLGLAAERKVIESEVRQEVDRREQQRLGELRKLAEFD